MGKTKPKITDDMEHCFVCERYGVQWHHIFYGTANRKKSDELGYIVPLCIEHHLGQCGVHFYKPLDLYFKRMAQEHYETNIGDRSEFIKTFGKSYL